MSKEKFRERYGIAIHEAGHALMGYENGHTPNYIDINLDISISVYPHVDISYNRDEMIISELHLGDMISLQSKDLALVVDVAKRYCDGLLAGTMAEYWFLHQSQPKFKDISRYDQDAVTGCIQVLHLLHDSKFDRSNFLNERLNSTRNYICEESNFAKIKNIANALMRADNFRIQFSHIESIIKK